MVPVNGVAASASVGAGPCLLWARSGPLQRSKSILTDRTETGSLFAKKSRNWVTGLSGSWFSPKSVFPLHDGVRELIGQNVIREVGSVPPLPLQAGLIRHRPEGR